MECKHNKTIRVDVTTPTYKLNVTSSPFALAISAGLAPNLASAIPRSPHVMDEAPKWLLFNVSGGGLS